MGVSEQIQQETQRPRPTLRLECLPWTSCFLGAMTFARVGRSIRERAAAPQAHADVPMANCASVWTVVRVSRMSERSTDWQKWHNEYDDPDSRLSERLRVVQAHVAAALDERAVQPGPIRIISMCSGQGRDVIGALANHPRRHHVAAMLVELDEGLAEASRAGAIAAGLAGVSVRCTDASTTDSY